MNVHRVLGGFLLACAIFVPAAATAQAQVASRSYEVKRGDTLFGVARRAGYQGVTRNQMILAIWRANQSAFPTGNINLLEVGTILIIPPRDNVAEVDPAEADRQVGELLAKSAPAASGVASVKPEFGTGSATKSALPGALGPEDAARRYREGLALEQKGDHAGAFKAYLEAGEAGHGLAQRRLGELYDVGSPAVKHDYQASLKWYQKAREQGVEIPKPIQRGPVH